MLRLKARFSTFTRKSDSSLSEAKGKDEEFAQVKEVEHWTGEVDYVIDDCISRH